MIMVMDYVFIMGIAFLGLVFGSFAGAQVWRLRARQLAEDKKAGEDYDKSEYERLRQLRDKKTKNDRSRCLQCGHALGWRDLVPVASWAVSGGRCRYCGARIGWFEPLMEVIMALLFVISFIAWPHALTNGVDITLSILWLAGIVLMVMLAAYDIRWRLLPDVLNFSFMAIAGLFAFLRMAAYGYSSASLLSLLGALAMLAGLYGLLYAVSKGRWIGFGDVKLSIGLALILGDWKLAFLALFLANLIGCLWVLPGIIGNRISTKSRISFGPLLIAGTLIAFWWGAPFVNWLLLESQFFI